ncbi:ChaN family lipoprotein [Aggregicoccus sp. 17bor-14]|uniref:hypothetical protein n=1 Tax=Myxococcaceae TaxID=31 RepID=UPI00129C8B5D|nr:MULTISPECIES: hypothetical protein [Myxococcaceae]MBF5043513.1 hypothetical protein [Simulacricoccus sp. 17bor-14]MRI89270.1 ChaN family lipoprotein [Aggregicoccus sp. 17bor-14]
MLRRPVVPGAPPSRWVLSALLLLALAAPAAPHEPPLYPGADPQPKTEHVYTYPLPEALAAARALLESHDQDVEPFEGAALAAQAKDGKGQPLPGAELITRWRVLGHAQQPRASTAASGFNRLRRYYVQGIALGPEHSVVRIFRIDREEAFTGKDTPTDVVGEGAQGVTGHAASITNQWAEFDQAAEAARHHTSTPDDNGRNHAKNMADQRVGEEARVGQGGLGRLERSMPADPRFVNQHRMPGQDDMRGSNELGVRDLGLERELVQRLEQFPSLEFTGGGVDPALPPSPPRAPPLTMGWEQEQGGMPFAGPGAPKPLLCGESVRGLEPLEKAGLAVLVGEQLGTREVPAAVGNLACQLAQRKRPVLLALPLPQEEQPALEAYLRSVGTREDQDVLLQGSFWRQVPRDGRSSRALVVLIERVRRWRAGGLPIEAFAYDARNLKDDPREQRGAEALLARAHQHPEATLLVLGGNEHVRLKDGARWNRALRPLGSRLLAAGLQVHALDTAFARGQRWACGVNSHREADCRIYAAAPTDESYSPPGQAPSVQLLGAPSAAGFDGLLHVGALTPALPALLPRGSESAPPALAHSSAPAAAAANVPEAVPPAAGAAPGLAALPPGSPGAPAPGSEVADGEEAPLPASPAPAGSKPAVDCGEPIAGADALFRPRGLLLLGEVQGSNEIPTVVGQLVCAAASRGLPVTLAVELPRKEQRRLNRFLASDGGPVARAQLLQGDFWHRTFQDGRSSVAMLQLLERARAERHAGLPIEVLAFDTFAQGSAHDALMAQALLAERTRSPGRLAVVLTGNVHARTAKGTSWDPAFLPLGYLLRQREPGLVALDVDHGGGAANSCKLEPGGKVQCGVFRETAPIDMRREFMSGPAVERHFLGHRPFVQLGAKRSAEGFDGLYYVGRLSPAAPAAPELETAAAPARPPP